MKTLLLILSIALTCNAQSMLGTSPKEFNKKFKGEKTKEWFDENMMWNISNKTENGIIMHTFFGIAGDSFYAELIPSDLETAILLKNKYDKKLKLLKENVWHDNKKNIDIQLIKRGDVIMFIYTYDLSSDDVFTTKY